MQVTIRPLEEQDAYVSVKWRNDPEVFKYTGNTYDHEITIESEINWIRKVIKNNEIGKDYRCAILADGEYVGNIYLTDIDGLTANYHIFIGNKGYWGKGVAKQASVIIIEYAFVQLGLKYVELRVRKDNLLANRLYLKLGFNSISDDGKWLTMRITHNK